jgi:hypothetical protein
MMEFPLVYYDEAFAQGMSVYALYYNYTILILLFFLTDNHAMNFI